MKDVTLVKLTEGSKKQVIHEDAEESLEKLRGILASKRTIDVRKAVLYEGVLKDQLIPLLLLIRHQTQPKLAANLIRVLCQITSPLSCLDVPDENITEEIRNSYREYLAGVKNEFSQPQFTWPLLKYLQAYITQKPEDPSQISAEEAGQCLMLVKNLLQIREYDSTVSAAALIAQLQKPSIQYSLIWYLLYQNFDSILLSLIKQRKWSKDVAEIIRLMFYNVEVAMLKKSLQGWMMVNTLSSSENTYPHSSPSEHSISSSKEVLPSKSQADGSRNNDEDPTEGAEEASNVSDESRKTDLCNFGKTDEQLHFVYGSLSGKSNSSISEYSATLSDMDKLKDSESQVWISHKRPREPQADDDQRPTKMQRCDDDSRHVQKRRKSKAERDQIYKDLGFSSGITDQNSSSSDQQEQETWRVRRSELSDQGYTSHMTDFMEKKYRKHLPYEKLSDSEKRERRKKLIEQRLTKKNNRLLNLPYDVVTENDIMDILSDFSLDFLIKGFAVLTHDLLEELSQGKPDTKVHEKENYSWMLQYFLPLAVDVDIPFSMIQMTYEAFHYITGETIHSGLEVLHCIDSDNGATLTLKSFLQAQKSFMEVLGLYEQNEFLESAERYSIKLLSLQIVRTKNIRQHYIFLIKLATSRNLLEKQLLENLVVANHIHLTKIQQLNTNFSEAEMTNHIKHFALPNMMKPYGLLLESFRENSATLNDCIFTMMHHVAGDLVCPQALDIKPIPETIQQMVKHDVALCDDWQDLIEYMMNYYRSNKGCRKDNSSTCSQTSKGSQHKATQTVNTPNVSPDSEQHDGKKSSTPSTQQKSEPSNKPDPSDGSATSSTSSSLQGSESVESKKLRKKEIHKLTGILKACNLSHMISWIQSSLLDLWRVKLYIAPNQAVPKSLVRNFTPLEPVPWFYANKALEVPLVPYCMDISQRVDFVHFQELLQKLGFLNLPHRPSIPINLSCKELLSIARLLGPVEDQELYPELLGENIDT